MCKRIIAVIVSIFVTITAPFTVYAYDINTPDGVKEAVEGVISYKSAVLGSNSVDELLDALSDKAGTFSSDWYYIALSRYGVNCKNEKSVTALKKAVDDFYKEKLETVKVTDLQRVAFALMACKEDITSVNGHNLLADATYNRDKYRPLDAQGVNSLSYALLLLDSKKFDIPKNSGLTRKKLINKILSYELDDGGFSLFGKGADVDITSIVLQALAPYKNDSKVKKSVEKSLDILSKRQDSCGAYKSFDNKVTAESTAQVIIALTSLGINPVSDKRFIKNGKTALDGLSVFKTEDGGYSHMEGLSSNAIAAYQSLCAFVAMHRLFSNKGAFYDFSEKEKNDVKTIKKTIDKKAVKHKKSVKKSTVSKSINTKTIEATINNNSKIENKVKKKKKKKSKIKVSIKSAATKKTKETKLVPKREPKQKNNTKPQPLYYNALVMLSGYILVFSIKRKRGRT